MTSTAISAHLHQLCKSLQPALDGGHSWGERCESCWQPPRESGSREVKFTGESGCTGVSRRALEKHQGIITGQNSSQPFD